ncbi:MAG TPA: serine/threonine-protein kinase, partial [Nitrososphaera sp.]|nr:serine/threonine-protein kinase [Nitrososphaera sp.]
MEDNQSDPNIVPQKVLDRYEVIETIGTGGTGTVFKAKDTHLPRIIAIKALNPNKESAKNIVRLHKEARTICQLRHPNIVEIYDFIIANRKEPMMVMEFVEGKSLECIIAEQGAMSLRESLDIFLQICDAMDYAHSRGVLHRDLAPSNILVSPGPKGRASIKVVDFGVAKVEDLQDNTFSKTGCLVGTVTVISPEQATGRAVDARSDVYSMGCLM